MYDQRTADFLHFHRAMIQDLTRTDRYLQAILDMVRPGDVVIDIGCGTGLLAMFACMAGARHVYAFEQGPVIDLARRLVEENGYAARITLINAWSTAADVPERGDVLVTETIGNLGPDEGLTGWVADARERLLKAGGRIIPAALRTFAAPVEQPEAYDNVAGWDASRFGLRFDAARDLAAQAVWWWDLQASDVLAAAREAWRLDLAQDALRAAQNTLHFTCLRRGQVHGLGVWFAAELAPGITLGNAPPNESPSWQQGFLPLEQPLPVRAGDRLQAKLAMQAHGGQWAWQVRLV